jgi:hypothetical protein
MISPAQLAQRRAQATRMVEQSFPTKLSIGGHADLPAARWSSSSGGTSELAGLLPTCDRVFRIRLDVLAAHSIKLVPERTTVIENGVTYRIERVRSANGDPALLLECKAA